MRQFDQEPLCPAGVEVVFDALRKALPKLAN
jgi:hypothetical protein